MRKSYFSVLSIVLTVSSLLALALSSGAAFVGPGV
jgi:hypothetical protein